jgi:hypothetical protein
MMKYEWGKTGWDEIRHGHTNKSRMLMPSKHINGVNALAVNARAAKTTMLMRSLSVKLAQQTILLSVSPDDTEGYRHGLVLSLGDGIWPKALTKLGIHHAANGSWCCVNGRDEAQA